MPQSEYRDDRVQDGHQYEYRVTAVNAAGPGKPSDASPMFTARPMNEKPKLWLDALHGRTIKVRAGEPIHVAIPMSGAPRPTVEWQRNGVKLPESARVSSETNDERTVFRIENSVRSDAGRYTITARNVHGSDSADLEVCVVDKPGPPGGPLTYTGTTQETVSLSWNPPADDGGGEIGSYLVEVCEFGTDSWRPVPGYCPKCAFTVKGLTEGRRFIFILFVFSPAIFVSFISVNDKFSKGFPL